MSTSLTPDFYIRLSESISFGSTTRNPYVSLCRLLDDGIVVDELFLLERPLSLTLILRQPNLKTRSVDTVHDPTFNRVGYFGESGV